MASVECYLKELDRQRDKLANTLVLKGVDADESETYNSLVEKVMSIETGGSIEGFAIGDSATILDGQMLYTAGIAEFSPIEEE